MFNVPPTDGTRKSTRKSGHSSLGVVGEQAQRFGLQFLSMIAHPPPSNAIQFPEDANVPISPHTRTVYSFPLAAAAASSQEEHGINHHVELCEYPSRNTMAEQCAMMLKVRRAVAKSITRCRRGADIHMMDEAEQHSSSLGVHNSAGLTAIIRLTAQAATKVEDGEEAMASPFVASCLRLLLQLCRASSDLATMIGASCEDIGGGDGGDGGDDGDGEDGGGGGISRLPILNLMRGGWVKNHNSAHSNRSLVSPRAIGQTKSVMHSQELELAFSEQRSTAQGLALLIARELLQCCNNLRRASSSTAAPSHVQISDRLSLQIGKTAVEVIESVSDVRVLGAAAGVVAHAVTMGQAVALSDVDRADLLRSCCTRQVMGQLRRLLCFPGFVVRGRSDIGLSSTCGHSLEGCSFGIRSEGMLDGVLLLMFWGSGGTLFDLAAEEEVPKYSSDWKSNTQQPHGSRKSCALSSSRQEFLNGWIESDFWNLLCRQLSVGGGGEISPVGCSLGLSSMHAAVQRSGKGGITRPEMLVRGEKEKKKKKPRKMNVENEQEEEDMTSLEVLVRLLRSEHLSKVFKWPVEHGGGAASHSLLAMATPMGLQMEVSQRTLERTEMNEEELGTSAITNSSQERPFDWWSPGLIGVAGMLYRIMVLAWSSIDEKVSNEIQRLAQQVRL